MAKFSKLRQMDLQETATATMTLYMLDGEPKLTMRPADEVNSKYMQAALKNAPERARVARRTGLTPGMIKANRDRDRENFAAHVIIGWEGVVDDDGKAVTFSPETCKEFLDALPDWIFDEVREFAQSPNNFVSLPDEEQLGNSSKRG